MNESRITRKYGFVLFAIALLSMLIYFGFQHRNATKQESGATEPMATNQPESSRAVPSGGGGANPTRPLRSQASPPQMTRDQTLDLAPNYMNVPVSFYGRVVDQDGNPLAGVRVVLSVRQWYHPPTSQGLNSIFPKSELTTDAAGYFQLSNASGDSVRVEMLEKEGYEPEPKSLRGFAYTNSDPMRADPSNPIIFRMWKADAKAAMITGEKFLTVIPDGRTYTFDLRNGTLTEGEREGDIRIAIKRAPDAAWGKKYEWSFDLTAINGGLVEEPDPYDSMYLAPEIGYQKRFAMDFQPEEGWTYGISKRFYVKTRNGQLYGRADIEIQALYLKDKQGRFGIKYAVNPSGSRTLR